VDGSKANQSEEREKERHQRDILKIIRKKFSKEERKKEKKENYLREERGKGKKKENTNSTKLREIQLQKKNPTTKGDRKGKTAEGSINIYRIK
jgi:hypothetical protein